MLYLAATTDVLTGPIERHKVFEKARERLSTD
jgi:hypothetical protein